MIKQKNLNYFDTPILFIIFNRPDTTKRVFAEIIKYKPSQLFIAADGSRMDKAGEKEKCEETRRITENIDWPCEVKRLYRNKNLGCKLAVSGAIDWFFKNVEEGIILEDDCLPNASFFNFCKEMLRLYKHDNKVMCISGDNFLPQEMQKKDEYHFSKYIHIWGWATWRRAWKNYDVSMKDWPQIMKNGIINKYFDNILEKIYWQTLFNAVYRDRIDTWDYQFLYHVWKNNGVSIVPGKNLVTNIGFGINAVHLKSEKSPLSGLHTNTINTKMKKKDVKIKKSIDTYSRKHVFSINLINVLKQKIYYSLFIK
jgi:hypothetical protein